MGAINSVFDKVRRGLPDERTGLTVNAQFFDPARIVAARGLRYSPDKLFLGVLGADVLTGEYSGTNYLYAQNGHEVGIKDDRHVITIAGTRAGKGRSAIIPNMKRYEGSILAIDPKGELALETAARRAERLKQRVCVVDPFGTTKGKLKQFEKGFNPFANMPAIKLKLMQKLDEETEGKLIEDGGLITDALVVAEQARDPHWNESARTLIEGLIVEVACAPRFDGKRNLVTVRDLLAKGDTADGETSMAKLKGYMEHSPSALVQRAAADFFQKPENERGSVLSTARRHLRFLNFREISASLQADSFDLSELKKEPMTVYLCLPGRHIGTCGRWLRLFVNLALQAMEKTEAQQKVPVLFILDEFAALGHMSQVEDAAGQIAGFGVKLWPILQDLGQLKALYKERWETFMGNAGVLQFFGNNDLTTLEWIAKRCGTTSFDLVRDAKATPGARLGGAETRDKTHQTANLLEAHEAALLFGRNDDQLRQLVIVGGLPPMILQRAFHDLHVAFR